MKEEIVKITEKTLENINDATLNFLDKTMVDYVHNFDEIMKTMGMGPYYLNRFFDGGLVPTLNSAIEIEKDITDSFLQALYGEKEWKSYIQELYNRIYSGTHYEELVQTYGKELFGSATFKGEKILAETDYFKLSYIPAKEGTTKQKAALFHVGGVLPYSDELFRLLPEANFFDRFIERGIPVYAMELKGDKDSIPHYGSLTVEKMIETIGELTDIAFKHNDGNKLILEGYCGLGIQSHSYIMAKPKDADAKIKIAATFVSPLNGVKSGILANMMLSMPQNLLLVHYTLASLTHGYVKGDDLRRSQDFALRGFFPKTPFGRFVTGWKNQDYANVKSISDLTPEQRKDLAGSYWISPQNCEKFPVPVDMAKFSSRLFRTGITENGDVPFTYKGKQLSYQSALKDSKIEFFGFFGAKDRLVPEATGKFMVNVFGKRYHHVVHPDAGHVSYVLTPKVWDKNNKKALNPNPIDIMLEIYGK